MGTISIYERIVKHDETFLCRADIGAPYGWMDAKLYRDPNDGQPLCVAETADGSIWTVDPADLEDVAQFRNIKQLSLDQWNDRMIRTVAMALDWAHRHSYTNALEAGRCFAELHGMTCREVTGGLYADRLEFTKNADNGDAQ